MKRVWKDITIYSEERSIEFVDETGIIYIFPYIGCSPWYSSCIININCHTTEEFWIDNVSLEYGENKILKEPPGTVPSMDNDGLIKTLYWVHLSKAEFGRMSREKSVRIALKGNRQKELSTDLLPVHVKNILNMEKDASRRKVKV